MSSNHHNWRNITNPPVGTFTNSFVNYHEGVSVTQTGPSPIHTIPSSFRGKKFHVNNENVSTHPVSVSVRTQAGVEQFDVPVGDSVFFVYTGNDVWDQVGGEEIIRNTVISALSDVGDQGQINRTILFSDAANTNPATYQIGSVPKGYSVSKVTVDVEVPFDNPAVDTLRLETDGGIELMTIEQNDVTVTGLYSVDFQSVQTLANGVVMAIFNTNLAADDSVDGKVNIIVEYLTL